MQNAVRRGTGYFHGGLRRLKKRRRSLFPCPAGRWDAGSWHGDAPISLQFILPFSGCVRSHWGQSRRHVLPVSFLPFAYYIHQLSPFIVQFGGNFGLHWYGFAYVMAFVCGYWLYHRLAVQGYGELPPVKVADLITLSAIFGVMLGGRLGWVLFYGLDKVRAHPLDAFKLWEGGMASHGGILGLVIFTWVYARWQKVSWPGIGDNLVVVAPIGLFFGTGGELHQRRTLGPGHHVAASARLGDAVSEGTRRAAARTRRPRVRARSTGVAGARADAAVAASVADLRGAARRRAAFQRVVFRADADACAGGDVDGVVHDFVCDAADRRRTIPRAGRGHPVHLGIDARTIFIAVHVRDRGGVRDLRARHPALPTARG